MIAICLRRASPLDWLQRYEENMLDEAVRTVFLRVIAPLHATALHHVVKLSSAICFCQTRNSSALRAAWNVSPSRSHLSRPPFFTQVKTITEQNSLAVAQILQSNTVRFNR